MVTLNKKQLAEYLSAASDDIQSTVAGERVIELVISKIKSELKSGNEVDLFGLCKFGTKVQKAKSGKVPGTTRTYTSPEKRVPTIKIAKSLKDEVL